MILLGVMFLLTFVLLGVGSGSTGVSDILSNFFSGSSATGSSLSSLQKQTTEHPKDAAAFLALANKLQADNKDDEAATALHDLHHAQAEATRDALLQLAGIYLRRARRTGRRSTTTHRRAPRRSRRARPSAPRAPVLIDQQGAEPR